MKEKLRVSLIEFDIEWENPQANKEFLSGLIKGLQTDLIILPEMFSTGFSMNVNEIAEIPFGPTYEWMKTISSELNCAICGSISTKENGKFYNRFYFVTQTETFTYDKKHLFGYGNETKSYSPGNEIISFEYLGWKIRPIVCYDLRFPVWCRNSDDYDILICPANWPEVRIEPWKALLKARAIENMAYTIGVNRIGIDDYDLKYNGNSKIFDAVGEELQLAQKKRFIHQTELSAKLLKDYRDNFGFLNDRDKFEIF